MSESITLAQFNDEVKKLKELKNKKDELEDVADEAKKAYDEQRTVVQSFMEANELENFKLPGVANVTLAEEFFVAYPQSQEDIQAFYEWLASKEMDHLRKVNSQTLNSLYKQEREAAKERGDVVFIPGLPQPSVKRTLRVLKG